MRSKVSARILAHLHSAGECDMGHATKGREVGTRVGRRPQGEHQITSSAQHASSCVSESSNLSEQFNFTSENFSKENYFHKNHGHISCFVLFLHCHRLH